MKYEKSQHQGVFIGIFIFSIISFLVILSAPFKMVTGETLNYWHLSGFGYHELRVFFILIPSFLLLILLIFIPVFDLAFKKQFTKADFRNIKGMAISGSMIGIIVSVGAMLFTGNYSQGTTSYTINVGFPYIYFLTIIILSAVALSKKNIPKLFYEVKKE